MKLGFPRLDRSGKLSHRVLLWFANFKDHLRKKMQKLPVPSVLPETQPPATTDAELTDFRQEQRRSARNKLKLHEKAELLKLIPNGGEDIDS